MRLSVHQDDRAASCWSVLQKVTTIALLVYFSLIAGGFFAAMDLSFSCFIAVLGLVDDTDPVGC